MNSAPYAGTTVKVAAAIASTALDPNITSRFVPKEVLTVDLTDTQSRRTEAILGRLTDADGYCWAFVNTMDDDSPQIPMPFTPKYVVYAHGHSANFDKTAMIENIGKADAQRETSIEIWGDLHDDPNLEESERPSEEAKARHRLVVYAAQWNFASGQKDPSILPSVRRQTLNLTGTGIGVPKDRPNSEGYTDASEGDERQKSSNAETVEQAQTKSALLDLMHNLSRGLVPEEHKEANQAFWSEFFQAVRQSRSVQDDLAAQARGDFDHLLPDKEDDGGDHGAPASDPGAPIAELAAKMAGQAAVPSAQVADTIDPAFR